MKIISFYRDYSGYTGGHQKVFDYLQHCDAHPEYDYQLYMQNRQLKNEAEAQTNPFEAIRPRWESLYQPQGASVVFLAGLDWRAYSPFFDAGQPKINLIQHIRHADPEQAHFAFLKHRAIRICVSKAVEEAIRPHANGPLITIRMGHQIPAIDINNKYYDLYILANKKPGWGGILADYARSLGLKVALTNQLVPKKDVLKNMSKARISLVLPNKTEGFYLPGIEAMSLSNIAIVPNCKANLEYMHKESNAILCANTLEGCKKAISDALQLLAAKDLPARTKVGVDLSRTYSLRKERESFHKVLNQLDYLWQS